MAKDLQSSSMNWTQIIGLAAGVLTASSLIPQVVKTWKEKKAEDVSLLMLVILLTGIVLWIVYGIKREDLPIIATNSVSFLVNSIMIVLRIKFRK
jgi:MtN3 and saliva related transmembrane protein